MNWYQLIAAIDFFLSGTNLVLFYESQSTINAVFCAVLFLMGIVLINMGD
jgi:hypothetical protein